MIATLFLFLETKKYSSRHHETEQNELIFYFLASHFLFSAVLHLRLNPLRRQTAYYLYRYLCYLHTDYLLLFVVLLLFCHSMYFAVFVEAQSASNAVMAVFQTLHRHIFCVLFLSLFLFCFVFCR